MSGFHVTKMFHPSHLVPDLAEAENWFERVLGRPCTSLETLLRDIPVRPGYPRDYSTFTLVADVFFDMIDPKRYIVQGVQQYPTIEKPHLKGLGWYVEGMDAAFRELQRHGIRLIDQLGNATAGDVAPAASGSAHQLFFTAPEDTGLRYQLFSAGQFPVDARTDPDWKLPPVADSDPVGIERCSHHTILTTGPERAARLVVDVLGGEVIHTGRNELLEATSIYVYLADSIFEYAVPDSGTAAYADWAKDEPNDAYYSITWKVADLQRTAQHLEAQAVPIAKRSSDTIVVDPEGGLGIPWGFTTTAPPGDPRPINLTGSET